MSLLGQVILGAENHLYPGVTIGGPPQELRASSGAGSVTIGDRNVIRESAVINCGGEAPGGASAIGHNCYLMAGSQVGNDCRLGDQVVLGSGALLHGHVHVHNDATVSANAVVQRYATIGQFSFVGALAQVVHDAPPFMLCEGHPARPRGVNVVALKRSDFKTDTIKAVNEAHRLLFRDKSSVDAARETLRAGGLLLPQVNQLLSFVEEQQEGHSGRGRQRTRRLAA